MTKFDKSKFTYNGGYLEYAGTYEGQPTYDEKYPLDRVHPTRVGMPVPLFVARFKYSGPFTKSVFLKELCKSFTVEEYIEAMKRGESPLNILREKNPEWYENIMNKFKARF